MTWQACGRDEGGGSRGRGLGGKGSRGRPWSCLLLLACSLFLRWSCCVVSVLASLCVREGEREQGEEGGEEKKRRKREEKEKKEKIWKIF
jgi:hypothetical protein